MIDTSKASIIKSGLDSLVREMAVNLRQSAFSSIVREMRDFAVAITDTKGEVVAQADCIPIMTAGISFAIEGIESLAARSGLDEDTAFIMNDPYEGGQHLQDVYLFSPLFGPDGSHVGYAANTAHHVDLGGAHAGLTTDAHELFQEGLRFPMTKFSVSRDFLNPDGFVRQFIAANVRTPDAVLGDLRAQFAANNTAKRRIRELMEVHGVKDTLSTMEYLKDYSEKRTRAAIANIPDGVYSSRQHFQEPRGDGKVEIVVTVSVNGDELLIDCTGTDDEVDFPLNCPIASTISAAQSAVRCMMDDNDIDFNEGCNRPLQFNIPKGSVLNPTFPSPVRSRLTPASRTFDAVVEALSEAVSDRAVATGFNTSTAISLSSLTDERYEVVMELIGHGWGGSADGDGADGLDNPISNCANAPVEALELDYSHFEIDEYSLISGSEGNGANSGGRGVRRVYRALRDGVQIAGYSDRQDDGAKGLGGASAGAPGRHYIVRSSGQVEPIEVMYEETLNKGDSMVIETGGGGGFTPDKIVSPEELVSMTRKSL